MTQIDAKGGCLCGAVRYLIKGDLLWSGYCHCESCRRQTSSPLTAYVNVKVGDAKITEGSLSIYQSSEGVKRGFCNQCGTPINYYTLARPEEIELYVASLDAPEKVLPQAHVHWEERLPWLGIDDDLIKHERGELDG